MLKVVYWGCPLVINERDSPGTGVNPYLMGNSSSSNKTPSPAPVQTEEQKEVPVVPKKCCGGCKHRAEEPVVVESVTAAPAVVEEPVVIEEVITPASEVVVAEVVAEEPSVASVTEALEKVKIEEKPEEPAAVVEETPAEPTEFSLAGKALKLDTAEDVAEIVEQIKSLKNLQKLSFVGNTFGIDASKAIAEAMATHDTIKVRSMV